MENNYKHTKTTVSLINYHLVFCPRYRRKIFLIQNVEERFKELTKIKCKELEAEVFVIECNQDYSHIFLNCQPTQSAADVVQQIKFYTSKILREEFEQLSKMPSVWTRNYLVSTEEELEQKVIEEYVATQRKRY